MQLFPHAILICFASLQLYFNVVSRIAMFEFLLLHRAQLPELRRNRSAAVAASSPARRYESTFPSNFSPLPPSNSTIYVGSVYIALQRNYILSINQKTSLLLLIKPSFSSINFPAYKQIIQSLTRFFLANNPFPTFKDKMINHFKIEL